MMTIYEKLARCSTPGEIQRMLAGNGFELAPAPQRARDATLDTEFDRRNPNTPKPVPVD